jgi:hypothetical protein
MDTVLKVDCEGDLRRALLKGTPSYAIVDQAVQEIWPQRSARGAKYVDEDGDGCTLLEETFTDFLSTAKQTATGQVLKLQLAAPSSASEEHGESATTAEEAFSMPWQHVEDGDEDGLHTVADLTDMNDQGDEKAAAVDAPPVCDEAVPVSEEITAETAWETSMVEEATASKADEELPAAEASAHETAANVDATEPKLSQEVAEAVDGDALDEFLLAEVPTDTGFRVDDGAASAEEAAASRAVEDTIAYNGFPEEEGLAVANQKFEEQIDIVLAAFDADGDGHLDLQECQALRRAAFNDHLSKHAFEQLCVDAGADVQVGLHRDALMCIYSCGNMVLERDFEAAKRKLEGGASQSRHRGYPNSAVSMILKNPFLAAPFAVDAAERLRQGVASQLRA